MSLGHITPSPSLSKKAVWVRSSVFPDFVEAETCCADGPGIVMYL